MLKQTETKLSLILSISSLVGNKFIKYVNSVLVEQFNIKYRVS